MSDRRPLLLPRTTTEAIELAPIVNDGLSDQASENNNNNKPNTRSVETQTEEQKKIVSN